MTDNIDNYECHIFDTKEIHIDKVNICDYYTKKLFVLDNIDEFNYYKIIKFILTEKFNTKNPSSVKFLIDNHTILFENLKFNDLKNMKHGYVFYVIL
jgi:hypothetical protein